MTIHSPAGVYDADEAARIFRTAARLNLESALRRGSVVHLPDYGQAVMTGDLHGHTKNFEKLRKYAMLERAGARHVILHEMIHADLETLHSEDHSHELLLACARYKCEFPEQVHFLQSNHELAQLTGYVIAKNGRMVLDEFRDAVEISYGVDRADLVLAAIDEFLASFPLAVRAPNGVFMSHSLPNVHNMDEFDPSVFDRSLSREELASNRTVFHLVWGRRHTTEHIESLARMLNAEVFITGHQPQETGHAHLFERLIILASNHNHGTFLPFDLSKRRTAAELVAAVRKFVEIA